MTKEKRSFLGRLTGAKKIDDDDAYVEDSDSSMDVLSEDEEMELTLPRKEEGGLEENWEDESDGEGQLTIDVYQTDSDIVIKSTIAGVKPEDLDVSINNDMVTIKGERTQEDEVVGDDYYYQECYWGSFSRSVVLPVDVLADKIEATLKNGILTIKLPKASKDEAKKIQVRGF